MGAAPAPRPGRPGQFASRFSRRGRPNSSAISPRPTVLSSTNSAFGTPFNRSAAYTSMFAEMSVPIDRAHRGLRTLATRPDAAPISRTTSEGLSRTVRSRIFRAWFAWNSSEVSSVSPNTPKERQNSTRRILRSLNRPPAKRADASFQTQRARSSTDAIARPGADAVARHDRDLVRVVDRRQAEPARRGGAPRRPSRSRLASGAGHARSDDQRTNSKGVTNRARARPQRPRG